MVAVSATASSSFLFSPNSKRPNYPWQIISFNTSNPRRKISPSAQSNGGNGDRNGVNNRSEDELDERRRSPLIDLRRWRDLVSVDPENIAAVGLTGLLAWASGQALFQLLFISFSIVLAALKYSFIAALLLFIMITLL